MPSDFEKWYAYEIDGGCVPDDEMKHCHMAWNAGRKSVKDELAEANAAKEKAEAKCAKMKLALGKALVPIASLLIVQSEGAKGWLSPEVMEGLREAHDAILEAAEDNPGLALLERLERLEAALRGAIEMLEDSSIPTQATVRKMRQALKEEPHE